MPLPPRTLVLASTSPYRKELLERLCLPFKTARPDVDERALPGETARQLVERLAEAKARAVAMQFEAAAIIGSDQVAVLDDQIIGKPGTHANAVRQLRQAAGRQVNFLTSLCVLDNRDDSVQVDVVPFRVTFRSLSDAEIQRYLEKEQPYNCAGAFRSEGLGVTLFEKMTGDDPTALVGLPLIRLCGMLRNIGVQVP
jgi:MAF protein